MLLVDKDNELIFQGSDKAVNNFVQNVAYELNKGLFNKKEIAGITYFDVGPVTYKGVKHWRDLAR